jgi:2-methylcitrate dehydratase PrpD
MLFRCGMINGLMARILDLDDGHRSAFILALSSSQRSSLSGRTNVSGKQILVALVIG